MRLLAVAADVGAKTELAGPLDLEPGDVEDGGPEVVERDVPLGELMDVAPAPRAVGALHLDDDVPVRPGAGAIEVADDRVPVPRLDVHGELARADRHFPAARPEVPLDDERLVVFVDLELLDAGVEDDRVVAAARERDEVRPGPAVVRQPGAPQVL